MASRTADQDLKAKTSLLSASGPIGHLMPWSGKGMRLPLKLVLVLALTGASFPVIQASRQPEPWLASVTLGLDAQAGLDRAAALDIAIREIGTSRMLGRAVDVLGLERDPEFSGSASTGFGVALELLSGQGGGPADARRRAIQHLKDNIAFERKPGAAEAHLLVKAADRAKAMRIAEAIATVYASGSELTASIPSRAAKQAQDELDKAEAALAAFSNQVGAEKLSGALVLKSRMEGLDKHIAELSQEPEKPSDGLAKAGVKDVLDGRVPLALADPQIDVLRKAYVTARLNVDALSVSLGPKHPRLLAARSEAETARQALADQLARVKKQASRAEEERQNTLKSLEAARAGIEAQIAATGVDLSRHETLTARLDAARKAYDASTQSATTGVQTVFEASVPRALAVPEETSMGWKVALGGFAGAALALTFAAWRRMGRSERSVDTAAVEAFAEQVKREPELQDAGAAFESSLSQLPPMIVPAAEPPTAKEIPAAETPIVELLAKRSAVLPHQDLKPLSRVHMAANHPPRPAERSRLGLDRVAPEDLPLVEKLRQVAPHVFADPVETAEIERLRQELAELRARVLHRTAGAA